MAILTKIYCSKTLSSWQSSYTCEPQCTPLGRSTTQDETQKNWRVDQDLVQVRPKLQMSASLADSKSQYTKG
jgi:hypothetical protein